MPAAPPSVALAKARRSEPTEASPGCCGSCCSEVNAASTTCSGCCLVTTVVELAAACVDFAAAIILAFSLITPWMISSQCDPQAGCPSGALGWMESRLWTNDNAYFHLFAAGGVSKWHPVNVSIDLNGTAESSPVGAAYESWEYPAGYVSWNELGALKVCATGSPSREFWGDPYGFCIGPNYAAPTDVTGGCIAMVVIAIVFAAQSGMCLVASRKGRTGFALCSTLSSIISLGMCIGAVCYFATWSYVRSQLGRTVGTVPLRAISPDGRHDVVLPVGVSMTYGAGWIMVILAGTLEALTCVCLVVCLLVCLLVVNGRLPLVHVCFADSATSSTLVSLIAGTSTLVWSPNDNNYDDWHRDPPYWIDSSTLNQMQDHHRRPTLSELEEGRQRQGDRALMLA
jgi:hypothetical protein